MHCFFIHIPKTAGETVIHFLSKEVDRSKILSVHNDKERKDFFNNSESNINEYKWVLGHIALWEFEELVKDISSWKIFTILRDPYERFVSQYKFLYYSDHPDHKKYNGMGLEEYIEVYKSIMPNFMCHMFSKQRRPTDALEQIKKHNVSVYYIEKLPQLEADLSCVTGREIRFEKVINKSKLVNVDFDKHRNCIEDMVAEDMELYQACRKSNLSRIV